MVLKQLIFIWHDAVHILWIYYQLLEHQVKCLSFANFFFSKREPEAYKSWIIWSWLTVNKQQAIRRKPDFEEYALICTTNYCFNLGLSLEYLHGQFLDISINSYLRRCVGNKESTFKPPKLYLQMSEQKNEADVKESPF